MYGPTEQPVPPLVITNPKTDAGTQLVNLHAAAEEATRILHACDQAQRDARFAVGLAEAALAAELDRGAQSGEQNAKVEVGLVREIEDSRIAASAELHEPRIRAATEAQAQAVHAITAHVELNILELIEGEFRDEAEIVARDLAKAREEVAPFEAAYAGLADRVNTLAAACHRYRRAPVPGRVAHAVPDPLPSHFEAWHLPHDTEPPLPPHETVLAWDKIRHPERYPVPVEVAEQEDELAVA